MELTSDDRLYGKDAKRQAEDFKRNPPSWVVNEGIWEEAKKAAKDSPAEDFYAVVTHIYKQMGGRIK